ncbi:MAG: hypothetical protein WCE62_18460 [Polyangiales bacterium]
MNRTLRASLTTLCVLLVAGCQGKGPTPTEADPSTGPAPELGTTDMGGAHPAVGTQDPHAGMALPQSPAATGTSAGQPDASGMIDVGAIAFKVPSNWEVQQPKSSMRRAQLGAPGSKGPAELIVFFFGPQGAGTAKANVDRWIGQFTKPDGSPVTDAKQTSSQVAGFEVTKVEVTGLYGGGMGPTGQPEAAQADQRLLAAIVNAEDGPYYFKLLGPQATVSENSGAFDQLISSIVRAP